MRISQEGVKLPGGGLGLGGGVFGWGRRHVVQ